MWLGTPRTRTRFKEALGGLGIPELFRNVVADATKEDIVKRSPRGQIVGQLLEHVLLLNETQIRGIALFVSSELEKCLHAGKKHSLPSLVQASMLTAFHRLRTREDILSVWNDFLRTCVPPSFKKESALGLQIILDRGLKRMIAYERRPQTMKCPDVADLNVNEANAVRYMAGYVAVKLLKKYKRCWKNKKVQQKHEYFVLTLKKMKAHNQPGEPDSPLEYSTLWIELIDRGGLYHISDDMFRLIEGIEMVVRRHFNVQAPSGTSTKTMREELMWCNSSILDIWEEIIGDKIREI